MPAKHRIKHYKDHAYYHIYNRGVEKRRIFLDTQDYRVFLSYMKEYLLPKDEDGLRAIIANPQSSSQEKDEAMKRLRRNNFSDSLDLFAFCLMPNHFHLLVYQNDAQTIDVFMNSLCARYVVYFNKKYRRVGPLFQGVYKAVMVVCEEQLLYLTRYIHRNPLKGNDSHELISYPYSSYAAYRGEGCMDWVKPAVILSYFKTSQYSKYSYESFVESSQFSYDEGISLQGLALQ